VIRIGGVPHPEEEADCENREEADHNRYGDCNENSAFAPVYAVRPRHRIW
jgi:hypothetical protein